MDDKTLTPAQAAKALHMSASRLRAITDEGFIYASKTPGGHRRYPEREVERVRKVQFAAKSPQLPAYIRNDPAHEQLKEVWTVAMEWVEQQARPMVFAAFRQLDDPGGELRDARGMAELGFAMPDGRTRYCRLHWSEMLYLIGEHVRTGEALPILAWACSCICHA